MPLTDLLAGNASTDVNFLARVKAALCKACPAIQNESVGTSNHAVRLTLVGRILANPDSYAYRFATLVAMDATLFANNSTLSGSTDAQIENAVNSLVDMFALQGQ